MIKHFETVWEEAEELSKEIGSEDTIANDIQKITEALELFAIPEKKEQAFGQALFYLCAVCQKLNVNSYALLVDQINEFKEELLERNTE